MKIACLGWGSLVWNPQDLPVRIPWFNDGPLLPIEFARLSQGERITLVLVADMPCVRSLWALMSITDLDQAKKELARRERTDIANIGSWPPNSNARHEFDKVIGEWAIQKNLEAVIWTALSPRFNSNEKRIPSVEEIISFLKGLPYEKRKYAEEYIRKAPLQINTDYRRKIEVEFNWTPLANY
ncbi:MAG: hypothetical protein PHF11_01240 [Candidatus Omnitrophica bacterium]|nr:hypothetical protein [Candidatus Omnitrophota bacterium]